MIMKFVVYDEGITGSLKNRKINAMIKDAL